MNELKLGDVTITRIAEMDGPIMPPDQFFPEIPEEAWRENRETLVPDHLDADDGMVRCAFQTWLLRSGGRTILIDTGIGNDKTRPTVAFWDHLRLDYLGNLARAGVRPEDVDLVVNTHLHADHVGWNTRLIDGGWVPTFPNATHLMTKADFGFWDPANNPDIADDVNENAFHDSVAPVQAAGQVQLWEGSHTIDANLRLEAAPGHTPGSSVVKLASGGDLALLAGDILHTPLQVTYPDCNSCFCQDPAEARTTRRRLLGWAADVGALVLPAHFSGQSAFTVEDRGDGFAIKGWAPIEPY
jgi:glyoxylase-like metal-dependent hydrolase (beta-lactamase superfamily II)